MKRRLIGTILLIICFAALAIPTGAIPAVIGDGRKEAAADPPTTEPTAAAAPAPSPAGADNEQAGTPVPAVPAETEAPAAAPSGAVWPDDAPAPQPVVTAEDGTRIVAVTITSDDMLRNDTYYEIDADALLQEGPSLTLPAEGYQILIIHTHSTEAYSQDPDDPYEADDEYRTTDPAHSVIRVGEALAEALEAYGLHVLHCTTLFDYPSYNGAYVRSGTAIEEYLAAYPGIRLVIDLHRDALGDGDTIYKTVANIDGMYAAQLLFVMGSDVNLEHPCWQENLKLALTLQQAANSRYGTLMRPTTLCPYRYNQQLTAGSLLLEVGTSGNTLAEAICAVRLFADAAGPILASYVE